jgi:hypothetical protein
MKPVLCLMVILCSLNAARAEDLGIYQHGTIVRMRMGECLASHHSFVATMSGTQQTGGEACPEYTLVSDKVVFVIVGKSSDQLIPLADVLDFRLHKNELAVRLDDAKHESKFSIKEMTLRSEWEMLQQHMVDELKNAHMSDGLLTTRNRE